MLLVEIAAFMYVLAGFTEHLIYRLFPANTCYFRPAIGYSSWLAGKSPCYYVKGGTFQKGEQPRNTSQ